MNLYIFTVQREQEVMMVLQTGQGDREKVNKVRKSYRKSLTSISQAWPQYRSHPLPVRFFEDLGYISLIICAKEVTIFSPVVRLRSTRSIKSLCILSVSRRFSSASSGVTSRHAAGGLLRCRVSESERAKKSPQCSQNTILRGCASDVSQWRLNSRQFLYPLLRQSRHLISFTAPRAKSSSVATGRTLNLSKSLGIWKRWSSSCCTALAMLCNSSSPTLSSP